jgi:3-phenylpropionate/trans-cinnamate dioxygenase ferredoxin reductase subunit
VEDIVIIGAGHAAGQAIASLRADGFKGTIRLLGEEPYIPYQRPPLSKKFLSGELDLERVLFKPGAFYEQAGVDVRLGTRVASLDPAGHVVRTEAGEDIPYGKLILATGSRVRRLVIPGSDLGGIHYLRTIADVDAMRADFRPGARLVVVGGGYIGLEVAAVAVKLGLDVTVLEAADRVLARVTAPVVSAFYERVHAEEGVRIRTGLGVDGFAGTGRVDKVLLVGGEEIPADVVVVGVGIVPNAELALDAGLHVEDGIVVDAYCRTSDPDIVAIGDCTRHPNAIYDRNLRLESVHNALEQAKTASATLTGSLKAYSQVPWFWSDQYDLKLQIAGLSQGHDEAVVRGDPDKGRSFAVFYLRDGVLIAVDAVNRPLEFLTAKQLIANHARIAAERLADESIHMKQIAG